MARDDKGRFLKGESGNPGGAPGIAEDVKRAFREATPAAVRRLVELSKQTKNAKVALAASQVIVERTLGKRPVPLDPPPTEPGQLVAALELAAAEGALSGSDPLVLALLRALLPQKYKPDADKPASDVSTTVNLVPRGEARPEHRAPIQLPPTEDDDA